MSPSQQPNPVDHLHRFIERLPNRISSAPVLLACSGGPDSVALVLAASELNRQSSSSFVVAHVNHKLRGRDSELDARFVRRLAGELNFPFSARVAKVAKKGSGNREELARESRYLALFEMAEHHGSRLVLTAHTEDDQAETVFMNLVRGAGPDGLAGIPSVRTLQRNVFLGRPLLGCPR